VCVYTCTGARARAVRCALPVIACTPCTYSKLTVDFLLLLERPSFRCSSCGLPWSNIKARETRDSFCLSFVWLTVADISARHMLPDRGSWGRLSLDLPAALLLPGAVPGASALVSFSCNNDIKPIIIFSRNSGGIARCSLWPDNPVLSPLQMSRPKTARTRSLSRRKPESEHARAGGESGGARESLWCSWTRSKT
jgi:hypothetical protein